MLKIHERQNITTSTSNGDRRDDNRSTGARAGTRRLESEIPSDLECSGGRGGWAGLIESSLASEALSSSATHKCHTLPPRTDSPQQSMTSLRSARPMFVVRCGRSHPAKRADYSCSGYVSCVKKHTRFGSGLTPVRVGRRGRVLRQQRHFTTSEILCTE